jgi:hypothetical protein
MAIRNLIGPEAGRAKFPFGAVDNPDKGEKLPKEVVVWNRAQIDLDIASNA